jgi:thiol:disulfide interchange protein
MSLRLLGLLCLFCFLLTAAVQADTSLPVHFTTSANPSPARVGEVVTVTVQVKIDSGWHVYSVIPAATGPAATAITSWGGGVPVGPTTEDEPIQKFDPNFQTLVAYHETEAKFSRQFRVSVSSPKTPMLTLHYQTCNDKVCLPPTDKLLPVSFAVAAGAARPEYAGPASPKEGAASSAPTRQASGSLSLFLLAALGAGLLAIITPCVFPLIPITLTNFVKQADGDKGKLVRLSGGYALGIVALYVALGAVVTATVGATGINKVASNPYVNLGIFVVFVVFALSFFETIQLTLPANLTAMQMTARKHGGTLGLVLLGITFVLASFTCTAPFVGTLLVAAASGERFRPLLGTSVFALAFVSPFLVFAAFPQWIARIPKGGIWLARVKAALGFIELAAALKFLSNADQVWNWQLLTQPVLLAAWALIFVCAGLYLWGTLRFGVVAETEAAGARVPLPRAAFAGVFLLLALYCFWGLAGRPIPLFSAFLPPTGYGGVSSSADEGLPWLTDYTAALAQAKAEGKPLFVDFTGVTCTNCRWNEKNVFPRDDVRRELSQYVRVQLYTDRPGDAANQRLQLTKFGDVALPLYGVVNPQTEAVVDHYAGTITNAPDFTRFLAKSRLTASAAPTPPIEKSASAWAAYTPQALASAAQFNKPIIIDFTAAWCVNCKEIEHDVFENPAVSPALAQDFVTLRADLTQWSSPASVALQKRYGFSSLPTIVILDPSGKEIKSLRITGRLDVSDFQRRLQQAKMNAPQPTTVAAR